MNEEIEKIKYLSSMTHSSLVEHCIYLQEEIERLNNIIEQIIEYIEYTLKNKDSDERMILQMVLAKLKVELKEDKE